MEAQVHQAAIKAGELINQSFGLVITMTALRTVFEIGIQDIVPVEGSITAEELAKASAVETNLIVLPMRRLLAMPIFEEASAETYEHSEMSLAFKDARLRGYMQVGWDMWLPVYGSLHTWLNNNDYQLSKNPKATAFSTTYGDSLFEHLDKNPVQAEVFNASMEHLAYPVAKLFPFASRFSAHGTTAGIERNVLVDVGGGKGQASREILAEYPSLAGKMILQDQESVLQELPSDLKMQLEPMAYSYFEPQPVKCAALYYMRNIMCDWPDDYCVKILSNQASAMTGGSQLLVATRIIPDVNVDAMTAAMDICMLTYRGAERTLKHFGQLVDDAGLVVEKVWTAHKAPWRVIESRLPGAAVQWPHRECAVMI